MDSMDSFQTSSPESTGTVEPIKTISASLESVELDYLDLAQAPAGDTEGGEQGEHREAQGNGLDLRTMVAKLEERLRKEVSEKAAMAARLEAAEGALKASECDKAFLRQRMVKMAERLRGMGEKVKDLQAENQQIRSVLSADHPARTLHEATALASQAREKLPAATSLKHDTEEHAPVIKLPMQVKSNSPNRWGSPLRFPTVAKVVPAAPKSVLSNSPQMQAGGKQPK